MTDTPAEADVPTEFTSLKYPLPHLTQALQGKAPVRIVAMGSSSTAGRADVVPYPHRPEMYLRAQFGDRIPTVDVLNRGKGGEEADAELLRFDTDIFAEKPSLVIWQVGTNAVFHKKDKPYDLDEVAAKIAGGLERLRGQPMDVVLMDPQYVTAMLLDERAEDSERMVALISAAAEKANVAPFAFLKRCVMRSRRRPRHRLKASGFAQGRIAKTCRSFVSGKQKHGARLHVGQPMGRGALS